MSKPLARGEACQLVVDDLFAMINTRRKMFRLEPVEKRAMASRCTLRFNLGRQRGVDFNNEKISITAEDMQALATMVNEQFGVNFENELITLCNKKKAEPAAPSMVRAQVRKPATAPTPAAAPALAPIPVPKAIPEKSGFGARLKRLFGGS